MAIYFLLKKKKRKKKSTMKRYKPKLTEASDRGEGSVHMQGWESGQKHSPVINHFESPINQNVAGCDDAEGRGGWFLIFHTLQRQEPLCGHGLESFMGKICKGI